MPRDAQTEGRAPHVHQCRTRRADEQRGCFGSDSAKGSRFIERFLTARQTLRTQKRDLYGFLKDVCEAALHGTPTPSLLPEHLRTGLQPAVAA